MTRGIGRLCIELYNVAFVVSIGAQGEGVLHAGHLLHAHAHSMARAVVGTFVSLAGLASESCEAAANAGLAVTGPPV